jgi:hypothetical protein
MMTFLTIGAAWFAFGYSVTDIIMNAVSERRINKIIQELEEPRK